MIIQGLRYTGAITNIAPSELALYEGDYLAEISFLYYVDDLPFPFQYGIFDQIHIDEEPYYLILSILQ